LNILVKYPRSGLPPTVLYKLSKLHYITLQWHRSVACRQIIGGALINKSRWRRPQIGGGAAHGSISVIATAIACPCPKQAIAWKNRNFSEIYLEKSKFVWPGSTTSTHISNQIDATGAWVNLRWCV